MAKLTKTMLKSVVKECLVEILAEGLGDSDSLTETFHKKNISSKSKHRQKSLFDQMSESFERKTRGVDNVKFENRVSNIAKSATSDPVLQSILEDTAKTTLQEQLQHESSLPRASSAAVTNMPAELSAPISGGSAGLDIGSLFGEATKNWGEVLERSSKKVL